MAAPFLRLQLLGGDAVGDGKSGTVFRTAKRRPEHLCREPDVCALFVLIDNLAAGIGIGPSLIFQARHGQRLTSLVAEDHHFGLVVIVIVALSQCGIGDQFLCHIGSELVAHIHRYHLRRIVKRLQHRQVGFGRKCTLIVGVSDFRQRTKPVHRRGEPRRGDHVKTVVNGLDVGFRALPEIQTDGEKSAGYGNHHEIGQCPYGCAEHLLDTPSKQHTYPSFGFFY